MGIDRVEKTTYFCHAKIKEKMKLSDLHNGESGVIVRVTGHGAFRRRIIEMGFVPVKSDLISLTHPTY